MAYIETDRLIFRDWKAEDLEHFARINSDPIIMEYYPGRLDDRASERLMHHFQAHIDKYGYGFYALENKADGAFVGFAGLAQVPGRMPFAPAVEIAWRFEYDFWGKGYARETAQVLLDKGFGEIGVDEIVAYCMTEHQTAPHVLERLGFVYDADGDFNYAPQRDQKAKADYRLYRMPKS